VIGCQELNRSIFIVFRRRLDRRLSRNESLFLGRGRGCDSRPVHHQYPSSMLNEPSAFGYQPSYAGVIAGAALALRIQRQLRLRRGRRCAGGDGATHRDANAGGHDRAPMWDRACCAHMFGGASRSAARGGCRLDGIWQRQPFVVGDIADPCRVTSRGGPKSRSPHSRGRSMPLAFNTGVTSGPARKASSAAAASACFDRALLAAPKRMSDWYSPGNGPRISAP
jgi:hypothetical protein